MKCFVCRAATKQFSRARNHFGLCVQTSGNSGWLSTSQRRGGQRRSSGDSQMRAFSFILTFAFFLVGPSLADSSEANMPGIGTFSYNGLAVNVDATQITVVAAR
jgi:hypothetical protein